jgi:hypothetical protein
MYVRLTYTTHPSTRPSFVSCILEVIVQPSTISFNTHLSEQLSSIFRATRSEATFHTLTDPASIMGTPTLTLRKRPLHRPRPNQCGASAFDHQLKLKNKTKLAVPPGFSASSASVNWRTKARLELQKPVHKTPMCAATAAEGERKDGGENYTSSKRSNKYKMELCITWSETGSCPYDRRCQYAHGEDELRVPDAEKPSAYKTVRCRNFWEKGHCPYGKRCRFVHDEAVGFDEQKAKLVSRHPKYKTRVCTTFSETGRCPYGDKCAFIHENNGNVSAPQPVSPESEEDICPARVTRTISQTLEDDIFAMHVKPLLPTSLSPKEAESMSVEDMALLSSSAGVQLRRQSSGEEVSLLSRLNLWKCGSK